VAYKADIQLAVKGLRDLRSLNIHLDRNGRAIDRSIEKIMKYNSVTRSHFVPTLNNLNSALAKAQANFDKANISTVQGIKAAENLANAQAKVNAELLERNNLLKTVGPRGKPFGPQEAGRIDKDITQAQQAKDLVKLNESLAALENRSLDNIAKKIQLKNEEIAKGQILTRIEKQKAVSPKFGGGGSRGSTIKSSDLTGFAAFSKRATQIQKTTKAEIALSNSRKASIEKTKSLASIERRRAKTESFGANLRRARRGRTAEDRAIRDRAISGSLIGGAFPLLFGQGGGASVGGALGGAAGGLLGGQFSFALSLVGTQIGSIVDNLVNGASELGRAIGPFTRDTQAVTAALGLQGSVQEAQLQRIERTQGKTAAFNASMTLMGNRIDQEGINKIKNFGETTRLLGQEFNIALLKLQAFAGGFVNFIANLVAGQKKLKEAEIDRIVKDAAALGNEDAQKLLDRGTEIEETGFRMTSRGKKAKPGTADDIKQLKADKASFAVTNKINLANDEVVAKSQTLVEEKTKELDLQNRINEAVKGGMNKELATSIAKVNQVFDAEKKVLQEKIKQSDLDLKKAENQKLEEGELQKLRDIHTANTNELTKHNKLRNDAIKLEKDLAVATGAIKTNFELIGESIASGVSDNIAAAIQGTKTLGEAAKSILNDLSSTLIKLGVNTLLGGLTGGAGGIFGSLPMLKFANGGRPPVGKPSLVGEKGPELFVPKRSGTIIPNDKLAGGGSTNISVNVDASGSSVQSNEQQGKELGRVISAAIQSELIKQRRPGGLLR